MVWGLFERTSLSGHTRRMNKIDEKMISQYVRYDIYARLFLYQGAGYFFSVPGSSRLFFLVNTCKWGEQILENRSEKKHFVPGVFYGGIGCCRSCIVCICCCHTTFNQQTTAPQGAARRDVCPAVGRAGSPEWSLPCRCGRGGGGRRRRSGKLMQSNELLLFQCQQPVATEKT